MTLDSLTTDDIKTALAQLGVSQEKAARIIRRSPSMVSMVLNGRARSDVILQRLRRLIARKQGGKGP